jgi:beta-glucosidase
MPQQLAADFDVEEVLGKLNMSAKIKLLSGKGWWHTESIPDVGIPSMRFSDGDWSLDVYDVWSNPSALFCRT